MIKNGYNKIKGVRRTVRSSLWRVGNTKDNNQSRWLTGWEERRRSEGHCGLIRIFDEN